MGNITKRYIRQIRIALISVITILLLAIIGYIYLLCNSKLQYIQTVEYIAFTSIYFVGLLIIVIMLVIDIKTDECEKK